MAEEIDKEQLINRLKENNLYQENDTLEDMVKIVNLLDGKSSDESKNDENQITNENSSQKVEEDTFQLENLTIDITKENLKKFEEVIQKIEQHIIETTKNREKLLAEREEESVKKYEKVVKELKSLQEKIDNGQANLKIYNRQSILKNELYILKQSVCGPKEPCAPPLVMESTKRNKIFSPANSSNQDSNLEKTTTSSGRLVNRINYSELNVRGSTLDRLKIVPSACRSNLEPHKTPPPKQNLELTWRINDQMKHDDKASKLFDEFIIKGEQMEVNSEFSQNDDVACPQETQIKNDEDSDDDFKPNKPRKPGKHKKATNKNAVPVKIIKTETSEKIKENSIFKGINKKKVQQLNKDQVAENSENDGDKQIKDDDRSQCPICNEYILTFHIERHVNQCIDFNNK